MLGKEPTVILKVIEEIIRAAIPLALIFGWVHWTEAQTGTVVLFVGVLVGGLSVLATRSQVTPDPKVDALIKEAVKSPPHTTVETVKTAVEAKE
jgi:hypothetical protein